MAYRFRRIYVLVQVTEHSMNFELNRGALAREARAAGHFG